MAKKPPPAIVVHRVCSWCGKDFAQEAWLKPNRPWITTWGICPSCLELLESELPKENARPKRASRPKTRQRRK